MFKLLVALSLSLCSVASVMAQQSPAGTPVAVLSGGIGEESARELMPRRGAYNVRFLFTLQEGDYVADVAVKITDKKGRVQLDQLSEGPILMVRLPAGDYVATFTYAGAAQTRKFTVRARGMRVEQLRWKRSEADGPPLL